MATFVRVIRAEEVIDFQTQYAGFGLTLEEDAATWFDSVTQEDFANNIEELFDEFIEELSQRGIAHNTVSQIHKFKQKEGESVRKAALRLKRYVKFCPIEELPTQSRLMLIFIQGLRNADLQKDLHMKRSTNLNEMVKGQGNPLLSRQLHSLQ